MPWRPRAARLAVALAAALPLAWPGRAPAQPAAPAALPVGTVAAALRPVSASTGFVGRVAAEQRVDITARVKGYLTGILFTEGSMVQKGAPLFDIDPAPFQAALQQAQGALYRAQATYANATIDRQRADELVKTHTVSPQQRDARVAAQQSAQGDVVTADGNLKTAQINLGYAHITAPITGRIGRSVVTVGNVVGPDTGPLTVMVSQDPIYVLFPVSQREFLRLERTDDQAAANKLVVRLRFSDDSLYPETGHIDFVDVKVDQATDTVMVRATFPNPKGKLVDGQLVRISVESGTPQQQVVIPQAALIADQEGTYVFVADQGRAAVKRVRIGQTIGPDVVITTGLAAGDQVITEGLTALRPGAPVAANPVAAPTPDRS
jgi:membrane fusion protein (multidrug efflux system)